MWCSRTAAPVHGLAIEETPDGGFGGKLVYIPLRLAGRSLRVALANQPHPTVQNRFLCSRQPASLQAA